MADDDPAEAATEASEPDTFETFGPADFEAMTPEEWEAAFDPDSWVTGEELLDRIHQELQGRIARRDVFAVIERITHDGERCLLAYSDEGYALIRPSGTVEGFGTVLRDVKPTVALCSIPEYEPETVDPDLGTLPDPAAIEGTSGDLGNKMLQIIGFALVVSGLALIVAWIALGVPVVAAAIGTFFLIIAAFLLFTVANARLSSRYRAEEYRNRLRSIGLGDGERPDFVPIDEASEDRQEGT